MKKNHDGNESKGAAARKQRIRVFHALLAQLGLMDYKEDMLAGYGAESTLELEDYELDELIARLEKTRQQRFAGYEAEETIRRLRSTVLTILQRMGIYQSNGDWGRVNNYLMEPRICGKLLYELREAELRDLVRKLRSIERKQEAKKQDLERLTRSN